VHIYLDGSVLVTHGGVESGQGLHTKMLQVVQRTVNNYITISEVLPVPLKLHTYFE